MSRVKISEYKAKKLLFKEGYEGRQLKYGEEKIPKGKWVLKVDQGVKKRMKQGLVVIDASEQEMKKSMAAWKEKGFTQYVLEPLFPHDASEEQYVSLERVREGLRLLHTKEGGIEIESHPEKVGSYLITSSSDIPNVAHTTGLPEDFLHTLVESFENNFFAFLEINPLVVRGKEARALDAAVLVDSAGEFFVRGQWTDDDVIKPLVKHSSESRVASLAATTPASLKLTVIDPDGSIFFLLSGGGGSIVIADEAQLQGMGGSIGNYGEYSGGPTREETYLYAKEILGLMLSSKAKKKALVIAGGVANFTDVKQTFLGIIDALKEEGEGLRKAGVQVFVRRGGPNESEGLSLMEDFLKKEGIFGSISGSDAVITEAVDSAITFVRS